MCQRPLNNIYRFLHKYIPTYLRYICMYCRHRTVVLQYTIQKLDRTERFCCRFLFSSDARKARRLSKIQNKTQQHTHTAQPSERQVQVAAVGHLTPGPPRSFSPSSAPAVPPSCSSPSPSPSTVMGRRKSKRAPGPKRKAIQPLETMFNCPFCNHEKSCEVKMEKARNTGRIQCNVCLEDFQVRRGKKSQLGERLARNSFVAQASINFLSEPIDVYNEWIDACEAANP